MTSTNANTDNKPENELINSLSSLGIPQSHIKPAISNIKSTSSKIQSLFIHKRLPDKGWNTIDIQNLLYTLSTLDTNCNDKWVGVGEREARIICDLINFRHYGFGHGIGRSGDLTESQPKAAGSSAIYRLTVYLVLDAIRRGSGLERPASNYGLLAPLCTGMSMSLVLSTLRQNHKSENNNDNDDLCVLWCRIDQKSCLKSIVTSGLRAVVIPTITQNDIVTTDINELQNIVKKENNNIVAIISTTSCFAPRIPDKVDVIGKICMTSNIPHVINHAYGLQCKQTNKLVNRACTIGRVDAIICSTDKNFLVPVGGCMILSPNEIFIKQISKLYAGRASSSPIFDIFITLLSLGLNGYKRLLSERNELKEKFLLKFQELANNFGERMLVCNKENTISYAMTLDTIIKSLSTATTTNKDISYIGSMLFTRCVSGTRVVPKNEAKIISGIELLGFGSSTNNYPHNYITAACAIGLTEDEMNEFFKRLEKVLKDYIKKKVKDEKRKKDDNLVNSMKLIEVNK